MRVVLFWDIDGTLLTTARAGVFALEAAAREVLGLDADLQGMATGGLTDAEVAALAIRTATGEERPELVDEFLRAYERHLPACLHRRQGRVLPGVRALLEDLDGRDDVASHLLTGNTPAGAAAKLAHYDLARFFGGRGAFCAGAGPRAEIARRASALAGEADARYVIGDTPADVACGEAIGARTIAVATGSYDADALSATGAWSVLERIPEPPRFRALVGLEGRRR